MSVYVVVLLSLVFGFINGFHDSANAVATAVATKVLSARAAIYMAAVLNVLGALVTTGVARTIVRGIVDPSALWPGVLIAGLTGAIVWNLVTWFAGIPSSSSHALVGGLAGAALAAQGLGGINPGGLGKIAAGLFLSPLAGLAVGYVGMLLTGSVKVNPKLQIASAAAVAFSHGSNDAQKSMGVIAASLLVEGLIPRLVIPWWAVVIAALAMGLGTATGGRRIIKTMGGKIARLTPEDGFAAETAAAVVVGAATFLMLPVSTTHVVSSAITAVGMRKGLGAVNWAVVRQIGWAMLLTIPASAAVGAAAAWVIWVLFG